MAATYRTFPNLFRSRAQQDKTYHLLLRQEIEENVYPLHVHAEYSRSKQQLDNKVSAEMGFVQFAVHKG